MAASEAQQVEMFLAGTRISDASRIIDQFVENHPKTIHDYDGLAGSSSELTYEMAMATVIVNSHLGKNEAEWFVERSRSAPWELLEADARLEDADPSIEGGLYDAALRVFEHFEKATPSGVAQGKISKVLYLMRPNLFPILDAHVREIYDLAAIEAASAVKEVRPGFPFKRSHWAAFRLDLIRNESAIAAIRSATDHGDEISRLSDLRLLDIVAWSLQT